MPVGEASRLMPVLRRVVLADAVNELTDGQLLSAFVLNRDADAFAALVRRHGPMVLAVCRRVIGEHATAEDAFQAVFLVLARRAAAVKPRERVANWLYGVAYRTALKARVVLARRRSREKQVEVMPEPIIAANVAWSDVQPVIDEELARLPEKLRLPVVLCDLEGRSQREVARQMGIPPATLATRLATARRTLAEQFTRRGITLSGGALAGLMTAHGTSKAVAFAVADRLARAAESMLGGGMAHAFASPHAIQLSEGVIRMMLLTKLKAVAVTALTFATLTCGLGLGLVPAVAGDDPVARPSNHSLSEKSRTAVRSSAENPREIALNEPNFDPNNNLDEDDKAFLRHLLLDACGALPTDVESWFFVNDSDGNKRAKVIAWLTDDDKKIARLAKKMGVPADKIQIYKVVEAQTGKTMSFVAVLSTTAKEQQPLGLYSLYRGQRQAPTGAASEDSYFLNGNQVLTWALMNSDGANSNRFVWRDQNGQITQNQSQFFQALPSYLGASQPSPSNYSVLVNLTPGGAESDAEFLKRVLKDVRGNAPTSLEEKYFAEDKDPKKREKLLDSLLQDPVVAKKLGDDWKTKMLAAPQITSDFKLSQPSFFWNSIGPDGHGNVPNTAGNHSLYSTNGLTWSVPRFPYQLLASGTISNMPANQQAAAKPSKFEKLVDELLAAKKTDAEMLEALTLATLGRLPTSAEKGLSLRLVSQSKERKADWLEVANALAGAEDEAKKKEGAATPAKAEVAPIPSTKP